MPFTLSHTALVLPLYRKRYFSATALIVGSVAPDFEYFFKMGVNSYYSHTIAAIFYYNIPVAVFLSFVFHLVVKRNLLHNLPPYFQRRFQDTLNFDIKTFFKEHWLMFLISAMIGAASHIFWDSFTHGSGYFVKRLSIYKGNYIPFDGVKYPLFYALQYISTGVGLIVLALFIIYKKNDESIVVYRPQLKYWLIFSAIVVLAMALRFIPFPEDIEVGSVIVSIISSACMAGIICGFMAPNTEVLPATGSKS